MRDAIRQKDYVRALTNRTEGEKAANYQIHCFYNSGNLIWPNRQKVLFDPIFKMAFCPNVSNIFNLAFCSTQLTLAIFEFDNCVP